MKELKVAIAHEYLNQVGGGEKVLDCIRELFPNHKIITFIHDKKKFPNYKTVTSFIQNMPFNKKYKFYMPLFPFALKLYDLKEYDIIISASHAYMKNIKPPKGILHICYCHTPMRYAWDLQKEYVGRENFLLRPFINLFLIFLKSWDKRNTKNVNFFIANSENVKNRIKRFYKRDAEVIFPPVDTKKFVIDKKATRNYYVIVSRLIEYKKVDLAIRAFNKLGKKLVVIGSGRDEKRLRSLANDNIKFTGFASGKDLIKYFQNAKALIHPQFEDAGITSLEAQSCGTPVIAFGKGGALESVIQNKTGTFFNKQTTQSLIDGVNRFEKLKINTHDCRKNAIQHDRENFKKKVYKFIEEKYKKWQK